MPAAQNERPNRAGQKWAKWTEKEDKTLLRLREEDSEIAAREFCRKYQAYFPDRSKSALAQRFSTLKKDKSKDTRKSLVVTLKLPKRPITTTETMTQANPSKQPRLGVQHDGGMDCDVAPPIQIGQILPQNNPRYPRYTAPQAAIAVPPRYAFQQPTAPGISPFQPSFSSGSYRPVVPTAGQTAPYPHTTTRFIEQTPHIPVQSDVTMAGTNPNNNPVPRAPPPASAPAQNTLQTDSTNIAESGESTDEESDDTSSTTDSELPEPDSLWDHGPAKPQQTSASTSSGDGRASTQEDTTPKKAEIIPNDDSIPPSTVELLDNLSDNQVDFYMIARRSQRRKLKNIQREMDIAELRRRVKELEKQLSTQKKQIYSLESAGSQHVAALEKHVADLVAERSEDKRRIEKAKDSLR